MATGAVPVRIRTAVSLFNRKFTPGDATSRRDVPSTAGVRGFASLTLNLHIFDLPVDGVYAMFFQEIICLAERPAAKESTVRR